MDTESAHCNITMTVAGQHQVNKTANSGHAFDMA